MKREKKPASPPRPFPELLGELGHVELDWFDGQAYLMSCGGLLPRMPVLAKLTIRRQQRRVAQIAIVFEVEFLEPRL